MYLTKELEDLMISYSPRITFAGATNDHNDSFVRGESVLLVEYETGARSHWSFHNTLYEFPEFLVAWAKYKIDKDLHLD